MFDVSWTDPARETVGQRKNRKDQQGNLSRVSSVRSVKSDESSQTQVRPSLLNLFGSSSSSKKTIKRTGSHPKLSALRKNEETTKVSRRVSSYTVASDSSGHEYPPPNRAQSHGLLFNGGSYHSDAEQSSNSEVSDSVFSGWTGRSNATESTWSSVVESPGHGKLVQSLSGSSFVTQSTEITVSPRDSVKADEQIATVVSISSAGSMPIEIRDSYRKSSYPSSTFEFPIPHSQRSENSRLSTSPRTPVTKARTPESPAQGWPMTTRSRHSDSWRPPDEWECPMEETEIVSMSPPKMLGPPLVPIKDSRRKAVAPPLELSHLQRSIRRMESASPKIILERLKEEWLEVADASVYRELELDKQLWMLTALRALKKRKLKEGVDLKGLSITPETAATKVLSLYENHASSSFLSALNPQPTIHHLSTSPLSPTSYPNIHPLCVPSPTAQLPYASNLFSSIHAFSLPAILPASSIPTLLKEIHRALTSAPKAPPTVPSSPSSPLSFSTSTSTIVPLKTTPVMKPGVVHLTILDPAPLPDTLGLKLRAWLDRHLILNLERQFRCINPGRLFPIWLADAGLRAEGSTIVSVRFCAVVSASKALSSVVPTVAVQPGESAVVESEAVQVKEGGVKTELKSLVGRMLWKEMWGSFVEGDKWWWEDEGIVEECLQRGTMWEYAVIEGVKEG